MNNVDNSFGRQTYFFFLVVLVVNFDSKIFIENNERFVIIMKIKSHSLTKEGAKKNSNFKVDVEHIWDEKNKY